LKPTRIDDVNQPLIRVFLGVLALLALAPMASASPLPAVTAIAFSPEGTRLAVGTYKQVVLYDTATWMPAATFTKVSDSVRSLAFHPDGKTLAVGSGVPGASGTVQLWDTTGVKPASSVPSQADTIEALAFRMDGGALLLGANDNKACLNSLTTTDRTVLDEHNGRVTAVAFSPRADWVFATGGMDKIVKIWDERSRKVVVNFDQAEAGITGLAFLPGGSQLVGSSLDGRLYWWQVSYSEKRKAFGGNRVRRQQAHEGGVNSLAISADGKRIVTGGADHIVCVWDAQSGRQIAALKEAAQPIYAVTLSPDGKTAAGAGREGIIYVWDVEKKAILQTLTPPALPKVPKCSTTNGEILLPGFTTLTGLDSSDLIL
jgi:WD40 repeat protein